MLYSSKYPDSHFLLNGRNHATIKEMLFLLVFNINACYIGKGRSRAVYHTGTWGLLVILPVQDKASYRVSCSIGIHPDSQFQYQQHVSVLFHRDDPLRYSTHNQRNARFLISHGAVKELPGTWVLAFFLLTYYILPRSLPT